MNTAELKKRIADVLGVSSTQSDLAYEIFLEKIFQAISFGITLKVPRIGYFQIKDSDESKSSNKILFASLPEDYTSSSKNFYLALELQNKNKNNYEIDSQVFSIGVGKPLLPLVQSEAEKNSEASYEILRKSIEERAKELIADSDQIPNYNIWNEFINEDEKDDNILSEYHYDDEEPDITTNDKVGENLIDTLLKHHDFKIENDFEENDISNELLNQKIDDEINSIEITLSNNISVENLLEGPTEHIEINNNEEQRIDDNIDEKNVEHFERLENERINEISSFAEELKNQIEELEKFGEEIIRSKGEDIVEQSNQIDNKPEEFNSLIIDINENINTAENQNDNNENTIGNTNIVEENISNEKIDLNKLLENDINNSDESVIKIEPPASSKELIFDDISFFNNDIINIEESELKQIVQSEISNLEKNTSDENNSDVLNKLLTEDQLKKINKEEDQIEDEFENQIESEIPITKIEWNWGDELKEEFGIGNLEKIDIEYVEETKNEDTTDNFDIENEFPEKYEDSPTIELSKTRVDLFTKLEETLEKEIDFLKNEIDVKNEETVFEKPEVNPKEEINDFEEILNESRNDFEIKDEKVILDFKTPPPQYEFIEEKPVENKTIIETQTEPLLKPPKKITIILSPEEQENLNEKKTISKTIENSDTEIEIIKVEKEKKNYWKYVAIILSSLLVLSVVAYFSIGIFSNQKSKEITNKEQTNEIKSENSQGKIAEQTNSFEQQTDKTTSELTLEEYSDFPISATPPKPIQRGNEINIEQIIPKENNIPTKTITPVESKKENEKLIVQKNENRELKPAIENKNVQKGNSNNEIRLSNMIFYDGKNYSFQTSSWKNKSLAEVEVNRLRSLGFNAFITEAYLPQKGGTWYRVRIGYFNSEKEAYDFMKKNNF
ncbi:MAG: SPOR domain-containing protein [Melioribacteraceae bacterium]|nr:SPOR domain-containing protein [Melioribacteraceae bacterium]